MHRHPIRAAAGFDPGNDFALGNIEDIDRVGVLRGDVGSAAVGKKPDPAWAVAHLDRLDHLIPGEIDDVDAVCFLAADVKPLAVGAEYRVLGILAAHLDPLRDPSRNGVDQQHLIVFLDGRGEPFAIGREIDRLGRAAQRRRGDDLAPGDVDGHQRVRSLIADEQPRAVQCDGDPARLLGELERRSYAIGGGIDDRDRRRALIRDIRERGGERARSPGAHE